MELRVYGEVKIKGSTKGMRVPVRRLIEFNSADMTFYPGEFLSTGAMENKDYSPHTELRPGGVVEAEIKE